MAAMITNSNRPAITIAETTAEDNGICSGRGNMTVINPVCYIQDVIYIYINPIYLSLLYK